MKKNIFLLIFLCFNVYPQSSKTKIDNLLNDEFFESCLVSIQVEDLTSNNTIYKKNEKMLLRPASNMKIITSAAGLLYLGPEYEFKTDLYYDGYVSNDTLYGNLYVVGGCDPDFTTHDLYYFVDTLKSLGISTIAGNLYGDISFKDSLYWGKGWMWDDDPSSDAPYLSALNLNDNCVEVIVQQEEYIHQPVVTIYPTTNYVSVTNQSSFDSENKFEINRNWLERKNEIIVKGKFPISNRYVTKFVNVLNPEKYFLTVFSEVLDSNFISISGDLKIKITPRDANKICTFKRSYGDLIENLNKTSDNLSAEMTLYVLSEKYSGKPATADSGVQLINLMIDTIGLNHKNYRIVDGSGVSHYNVVSAELLVNILKYFYSKNPKLYEVLYNSFPIAGLDGTLENRMRKTAAANNVHAKTGTLTGVSTLSGYLINKKSHTIAFSIMMQNYVGSSKKAKEFQDEICKILSENE
ncbi:MAG: D-alanyl-D-alanine carboxypeptidase/D-alanyl-D-alanine-endopeptidase [Ignavibacteriales bacterium]|nr:D-alanyl-D-alanine carboxypeptidase/D-alanyl-D-alanine-endopeptidase [Ignavibacteriales bacterium]